MKNTLIVMAALALGISAAGCSPLAAEACDEYCNCQPCNDRDYEECVINVEEQLDRADAYDCGAEADDLIDCAIERSWCDNNHWRYDDVCSAYALIVSNCVDAHSSRYHDLPGPG